jgi:chaperonin GroEL
VEYAKVKSVAKQVTTKGPLLSQLVLDTMRTISEIVGDTLGPGGRQVLIERYEHGMPPMITKDGVTVFRSLGFENPTQHCIMEAARDAAVRTATEAGDGTTTATILSEAIARRMNEFCTANPRVSPQKVVRRLEEVFRDIIEPTILGAPYIDEDGVVRRRPDGLTMKVDPETKEGKELMFNIARISANGDEALARAVVQCFEITGDAGNVTIAEQSGPSSYEVEEIDGYPIPIGYEDSCAKFYTMFINDQATQMCRLENPVFVLYHGTLSDTTTAYSLLTKVGDKYEMLLRGEQNEYKHKNVVFVAVGFSEAVLGTFAASMRIPNSIKIFPLVIPKSPMPNFQSQFLQDLSAITGATIFDPINRPLDTGELEDLGPGVTTFEASRFRSSIIGRAANLGQPWEDRLIEQISVVEAQLENPISTMDKILLQERLAKLTGGIAKLKVIGASNGELKEKRDRADDAVCAVRGAIKHGCLPGGGWTLMRLVQKLGTSDPVIEQVLNPALMEPVTRLLTNCGLSHDEIRERIDPIISAMRDDQILVYDAMNDRHGDPIKLGILDSTPAVLEAIRNSISIASLVGTLGGTVVQARDRELERTEARDVNEWIRNANVNPADERA